MNAVSSVRRVRDIDVIVIGAGHAGLGMSYSLRPGRRRTCCSRCWRYWPTLAL